MCQATCSKTLVFIYESKEDNASFKFKRVGFSTTQVPVLKTALIPTQSFKAGFNLIEECQLAVAPHAASEPVS